MASGAEPSLVSVKDITDDSQLITIELDVPEGDTEQLLSEDQATEDNDGELPIQKDWGIESRLHQRKAKWWCLEPEVRENYRVVITAWVIVLLGIGCLITGIVLEIINSHVEVIRGLAFFIVAIILLVPGIYAVTHIYLAAKRVGRITFSTIPFFRR